MTDRPTQKGGASLPDDFADTLRTLRKARDPRFLATLRAAHQAGWTYALLAHPIGVTEGRAQQLANTREAEQGTPLPDIPTPPKPPAPKRPQKPPKPSAEMTAQKKDDLRRMQAEAESPDALDEFYVAVKAFVRHGVRRDYMADVLGVTEGEVRTILARAMSAADRIYKKAHPDWASYRFGRPVEESDPGAADERGRPG